MNLERLLVKAKLIDSENWIHGHYVFRRSLEYGRNGKFLHHIHVGRRDPTEKELFEIDPDTICQCTGLKDKNGALIFEGDKLQGVLTEFSQGGLSETDVVGTIKWVEDVWLIMLEDDIGVTLSSFVEDDDECEVIGNIHDKEEIND